MTFEEACAGLKLSVPPSTPIYRMLWDASRKQALEDAEAELAKAWEAGRDAAAELIADTRDEVRRRIGPGPMVADLYEPAIRRLQPPGGKAK